MPGQTRSHFVAPPVFAALNNKDEMFENVKSSKKHLLIKQLGMKLKVFCYNVESDYSA